MVLLDTCALLWLVNQEKRLSQNAIEEIERSVFVYISAISGFEVSLKYRQGKLGLPLPPREWFAIAVEHHDLTVLPLDLEICVSSNELPPHHKDPCDRFIIATAKLHHLPVITADPQFRQYGVEVIDC